MNSSKSTLSHVPDSAAQRSSVARIQRRAAPMPRFGSSVADNECRVPKLAYVRT
jgi:hypothetical protein